jgi:SAM-dependent methyltransferase
METLLPDRLRALWQSVERNELTVETYTSEQERLLADYQKTWSHALLQEGYADLPASLLAELGGYVGCEDMAEIRLRCTHAVANVRQEWETTVESGNPRSVELFYDETQAMLYELMWWHTLCDDSSPLAYVTALEFARQHGCRRYLDFGAGVGSGGILFARHGLQVGLADISSPLLRFTQWRLDRRELLARYFDLKSCQLPRQAFDFITAMDVFEHLVDPAETVAQLGDALQPGGYLYARIAAESDEDRPQHIVRDFGPTFERLQACGFREVWRDEWLWGHQVFQKA